MARGNDPSLQYFPLDCVLDSKFALIEAEFGLKGFAVVVKLYQRIYGTEGYYCEWNDDIGMLFSRRLNEDHMLVTDIVNRAVTRGIFSDEKLKKYQILTSRGIQKQYLRSTARRKNVKLIREYLLVNVDQISYDVNIISLNVCNQGLNVCRSTQSKSNSKSNSNSSSYNTTNKELYRDAKEDKLAPVIKALATEISATPSTTWIDEIEGYVKAGIKEEVILHAIQEAVDNNARSWAYVRAILRNYLTNDIKTMDDVRDRKRRYQQRKQRNDKKVTSNFKLSEKSEESYDKLINNIDKIKKPRLKGE